TVDVPFVDHRQRFPTRGAIHSPTDVRYAIGVSVLPTREVSFQKLGVEPRALDRDDVVVLDFQGDRRFEVTLEREVYVSRSEEERSVHRFRVGKTDARSARPIRHLTGTITISPRTTHLGRTGERDPQIRPARRGHP